MGTLLQDLRYAVRILVKSPGFTIIAVLTLALGIGASTAIFSYVDAVMIRPLSYPQSAELVTISQSRKQAQGGNLQTGVSALNVLDIQKNNHIFREVGYYLWESPVLGAADPPEQLRGVSVSTSLPKLLGVEPSLGRWFTPEEGEIGHNQVALLCYGLWQRQFGGRRDVIGHEFYLNDKPYTVIGVMPKDFSFPSFPFNSFVDIMFPLALGPSDLAESQRSSRNLKMLGRLQVGVTLKQAQAEMDTIAAGLAAEYPNANKEWGLTVKPLHSAYLRPSVLNAIIAIVTATLLVLSIACINVASLLLVRATTRRKEIAVRVALGASRKQIFSQFLIENVLLGVAGGLAGVLIAWTGVKLLVIGCAHYYQLPGTERISLNMTALAFCFVVSVVSSLIFGVVPSFHSSKVNLNESLKEGASSVTAGTGGRRIRSALVISEIALAMVLVALSGLLIRTFVNLLNADLGFASKNVLTFGIDLPTSKYQTGMQQVDFFKTVLERFQHLAGVEGAASYSSRDRLLFRLEGHPPEPPGQESNADVYSISPGFIKVMRATLIAGREFTQEDDANTLPVAVINETLARLYFPNVNPIGRHVIPVSQVYGDEPALNRSLEVVGVVKDIKTEGGRSNTTRIYLPYMQYPDYEMEFCIRTAAPPTSLVSAMRSAVMSVDRKQPADLFESLEDWVGESYYGVRFPMIVVAIFAGVSLFLSAVGIFGAISFLVTQRTREIGIRIALGAQRRHVTKLVLAEALYMTIPGLAIGAIVTLGMGRFLASLLFNVKSTDPVTFVGVAFVLMGVALLACYIPARRATRVDPMVALRYE